MKAQTEQKLHGTRVALVAIFEDSSGQEWQIELPKMISAEITLGLHAVPYEMFHSTEMFFGGYETTEFEFSVRGTPVEHNGHQPYTLRKLT